MARLDPGIRTVASDLGHRSTYSVENARRRLGWSPRPVEETIVDCAESLLRLRAETAQQAA
jgi:nucleoside-diphosphate-sugar epimerase